MAQKTDAKTELEIIDMIADGVRQDIICERANVSKHVVDRIIRNMKTDCPDKKKYEVLPSVLSPAARYSMVRNMEHACRCYVNAYVMLVEGGARSAKHGVAHSTWIEREWTQLLRMMQGILTLEGFFPKTPKPARTDDVSV